MMSHTLYSYERLFGEAKIKNVSATVDGAQLPTFAIDSAHRSINIYAAGRETWTEADVRIDLDLPMQEIRSKFPPDFELRALFRVNCDATNLRVSNVVGIKGGTVTGTLTIRRDLFSQRAVIEAFVVAPVDDISDRILREAEPWTILFSQPPPREPAVGKKRKGRDVVQTVWVNFREPGPGLEFLMAHEREASFIDLTAKTPALYLNEGIDGYRVLLELSRPASRFEAALHDMETRRLAFAVWSGLLTASINAIEVDSDTNEVVMPDGWQGDALEILLPKMFPNETLRAAARNVVSRLADREFGMGFIQTTGQAAIGEMLGTSAVLKRHLNAFVEGRNDAGE